MFRVQFFCDDKKLAAVMHALMGMAIGSPEVQPVSNAVHRNGKVAAANGSLSEMFAKYAKSHKLDKFRAVELVEFCKIAGMAPASRNYLMNRLRKAGSVKKHGTGSKVYYTVVA